MQLDYFQFFIVITVKPNRFLTFMKLSLSILYCYYMDRGIIGSASACCYLSILYCYYPYRYDKRDLEIYCYIFQFFIVIT